MVDKYFKVPFAENGDRTVIPVDAQVDNTISYDLGYTQNYALDQTTDPNALDVPRRSENQFKRDVSNAMREVQESGLLSYDAQINYKVFARVTGSDGEQYKAALVSGPDQGGAVDPVGDLSGTWGFPAESGAIIQRQSMFDGGVIVGNTVMPDDNTKPQQDEGDEFLVLPPFTPLNSNSLLTIEVNAFFSYGPGENVIGGIFRDNILDSIASGRVGQQPVAGRGMNMHIVTQDFLSGSTLPTIFKFRMGSPKVSGITLNGAFGLGKLDGTLISTMSVIERVA